MTTYNRTEKPDEIRTNARVYEPDAGATLSYLHKGILPSKPAVMVKVLSKNLKGKIDYHGKPYEPLIYIYTCNDDLSIRNSVSIEELKEGDLFKIAETNGGTVYSYLGYDRVMKKYGYNKFTDTNAVFYKKKGTRVVTNFNF